MCEFYGCGCEEDFVKQQQVSGQVTGSSLKGIPVVAVANLHREHPVQHADSGSKRLAIPSWVIQPGASLNKVP